MNYVKLGNGIGATVESAPLNLSQRKWPISYRGVGVGAVFFDFATILSCGVFAGILYNFEVFGVTGSIRSYLASSAVIAVLFVSLMERRDLYDPAKLLALRTQIQSVAVTWLAVFLFLSGVVFALKIGSHFSRGAIFSLALCGLCLLLVQRIVYCNVLARGLAGHRFSGRRVILITDEAPEAASPLVQMLLRYGFLLDRQFVLPAHQQGWGQFDELFSGVVAYLRGSKVEEVIVGVDVNRWKDLSKLLSHLRVLPLPINLVPIGTASDILRHPLKTMDSTVCIELQRGPLGAFERGIKRSFDVVAALAVLVLLSPLLAITAVLIKLDSRGPILFRQARHGFNGQPFHILKFRTMSVLENGPQISQAERDDARVTRIGKLLRRCSIDELPQLLNVLSGSMSLVGPRPHAAAHDNHFNKILRNYAFRQHVRPGLTGWAQVHGYRGPTPTLLDIRRRVEFDLWYIKNWSVGLDCLIILRTFAEILRGRNAY